MFIHEAERRDLWLSLSSVLGQSQADTLMTMLPPQPLPELATRADLAALTASLQADIRASGEALRHEFGERFAAVDRQFGELRGEFGELRGEFGELRGEFGELRGEFGELRGEFGELRGELGELRGELRAEISRQTLLLGLTLGSMIIAVLGTLLTLGFTGAFS